MASLHVVTPKFCPACAGPSIDGTMFHAGDCSLTRPLPPVMRRMCSCCRKPIDGDSLTLNGMFAHVACVEAVMREPGTMAVVTDLRLATDEQVGAEFARRTLSQGGDALAQALSDDLLRAECERRKLLCDGGMVPERAAAFMHFVGDRLGFEGAFAFTDVEEALDDKLDELKRLKCEIDEIHKSLAMERDDWKRRAEAAEQRANLHESLKRSSVRSREETHVEFLRLVELLTPEQARMLLDVKPAHGVDRGPRLLCNGCYEPHSEGAFRSMEGECAACDLKRREAGPVSVSERFAVAEQLACRSAVTRDEFLGILDGGRPDESGPGIAAAELPDPRHVAMLDEATMADLLAADAD